MSAYVYTMRKAKQSLLVAGTPVKANLFDYAYKPGSLWNQRNAPLIARLESAGERAFEEYDGGYVIVGDKEHGISSLDGACVYRRVKRGIWNDSYPFPGDPEGYIEVRNNRCHLVRSTAWTPYKSPKDREYRQVIKDGQFAQEVRVRCPACDTTRMSRFSGKACTTCSKTGYITPQAAEVLKRLGQRLCEVFDVKGTETGRILNMSDEELMA